MEVAEALTDVVQNVHARLFRGRLLDPPPRVAFYPYTEARSTVRERDGRLEFRLSDHLRGAPDLVLEGIFGILLCRMNRVPDNRADPDAVRAYKQYIVSSQSAPTGHGDAGARPARKRGRKHIDPVGTHRSLLESYLRVSLDMGLTLERVPQLSWSKEVARHRFGHWDPDHNAVVVSQILDDPAVPEFVLDYVLYHELLHIVHPVKMGSGTKRIVHGAAFKRDERKFPRWKEGEEWISKLASRRWRRTA